MDLVVVLVDVVLEDEDDLDAEDDLDPPDDPFLSSLLIESISVASTTSRVARIRRTKFNFIFQINCN